MNKKQKTLKNWLLVDRDKRNWGWQVIVDTLAIGESLPLRIVSYISLNDLYKNIEKLSNNNDEESKKARYIISNNSSKQEWDTNVKKVIEWANNLENCEKSEGEETDIQLLTDLVEIYPLLAPEIFPVLPANSFPMEMLSRISFNEYRVFCLLWFYYWIIIKDNVPKDKNESIHCENSALSFKTMRMVFQWITSTEQQNTEEYISHRDWLIAIGPCMGGKISILSEETYNNKTIDPVVKFIENFSHGISQAQLFHKHRFRRAAYEASHLPIVELERRLARIQDALNKILESDITDLNQIYTRQDFFHITLWALFCSLRTKGVKETLQKHTLVFLYEGDYTPAKVSQKNKREDVCLTAKLGINEKIQIAFRKKKEVFLLNESNQESLITQYGFVLYCDSADAEKEDLTDLQEQFSRFYLRAYRNNRAQDGVRLLIISDRLHREVGDTSKSERKALHGICFWLSGLMRSSSTVLYRYSVHNSKHPFNNEDKYSRNTSNILDSKDRSKASLNLIKFDAQSLPYRAVKENNTQILFDSDIEIQQSTNINIFRSAIAAPVRFNGRTQGVIEVSAFNAYQFSWGQQILMEQAASVIAPFFYIYRFLETLGKINARVLQFHNKDLEDEGKLYSEISSDLADMFLCDGASFWLFEKNEEHILSQKGHYKFKFLGDKIDIKNKGFFVEKITEAVESDTGFCDILLTEDQHGSSELIKLNIKHIALVPILQQTIPERKMIGVIMLYARDKIGFKDSWSGIVSYMAKFLSLVFEAVHAFVNQRKLIADAMQHEIANDIEELVDKAKSVGGFPKDWNKTMARLDLMLQHKWLREKLETGAMIFGYWKKQDIELIDEASLVLSRSFKLPMDDMDVIATRLRTRINALIIRNINPNINDLSLYKYITENFERLSLYQRLTGVMGDEELTELAMSSFMHDKEEKYIDINQLFNRLIEKNSRIKEKKLKFTKNIHRGLEIFAWPTILDQILKNLVENAIKYSLDDSTLFFESQINTNGDLKLSITNTGVALDNLDECSIKLVKKKTRGSNATEIGGSGLGLYIVDRMCAHILKVDFFFDAESLGKKYQSPVLANYSTRIHFPSKRIRIKYDR